MASVAPNVNGACARPTTIFDLLLRQLSDVLATALKIWIPAPIVGDPDLYESTCRESNASRKPSPTKAKERTRIASAVPGTRNWYQNGSM